MSPSSRIVIARKSLLSIGANNFLLLGPTELVGLLKLVATLCENAPYPRLGEFFVLILSFAAIKNCSVSCADFLSLYIMYIETFVTFRTTNRC